jgi:hypothetical protein
MSDQTLERVVQAWGKLNDRRYPTMVLMYDRRTALPHDFLSRGAARTGMVFMDFAREVAEGKADVVVGAFMSQHMLDWLRATARALGGFWLDSADSIVTTWPERDRRWFFLEFLKLEPRGPDGGPARIVVGSALTGALDLPEEELGQGVIIHICDAREGAGDAVC